MGWTQEWEHSGDSALFHLLYMLHVPCLRPNVLFSNYYICDLCTILAIYVAIAHALEIKYEWHLHVLFDNFKVAKRSLG